LPDAEAKLRGFGEDFLDGKTFDHPHLRGLLPANRDLVAALEDYGEFARIYKCDDDGSVEIKSFEQAEAA
jgi:hypothetical protein